MSNIDLSTKPTYEIIDEMSKLEQKIQLETMKYNLLSQELIKRFPFLEQEQCFREKDIKVKDISKKVDK